MEYRELRTSALKELTEEINKKINETENEINSLRILKVKKEVIEDNLKLCLQDLEIVIPEDVNEKIKVLTTKKNRLMFMLSEVKRMKDL